MHLRKTRSSASSKITTSSVTSKNVLKSSKITSNNLLVDTHNFPPVRKLLLQLSLWVMCPESVCNMLSVFEKSWLLYQLPGSRRHSSNLLQGRPGSSMVQSSILCACAENYGSVLISRPKLMSALFLFSHRVRNNVDC